VVFECVSRFSGFARPRKENRGEAPRSLAKLRIDTKFHLPKSHEQSQTARQIAPATRQKAENGRKS
tara:strand:+ start:334 stop:531 length:198 start_codon:yes stop_codon:yes gene_type:complete